MASYDKDTVTVITATAGAAFGLLGTFLGILNTWRAFDRDRVRLRVRPVWYFRNDGVQTIHTLGIEITNLSYVAVTVSQVGFTLRQRDKVFTFIAAIPSGGHLPQRMEPRTSITTVAPLGTDHCPPMRDVRRAFAQTACGCRFTGTSPALRGVVHEARSTGTKNGPQRKDNA